MYRGIHVLLCSFGFCPFAAHLYIRTAVEKKKEYVVHNRTQTCHRQKTTWDLIESLAFVYRVPTWYPTNKAKASEELIDARRYKIGHDRLDRNDLDRLAAGQVVRVAFLACHVLKQ